MTEKRCCFCLKLETGCLVLGAVTFVLALLKFSVALSLYMEELCHKPELALDSNGTKITHHVNHILGLTLDKQVIFVVLSVILVVGVLWMMFSAVLVLGIVKRNSTHVMSYFLFGSAVCILFYLSSLLEIVNGMWVPSVITVILTTMYVRCLVCVYKTYDELLLENAPNDREQLLYEDEFNVGD